VAAVKPAKSVAYEAAMKAAAAEPAEGATTMKKKAQEKLAAKANPVAEEPVVEATPEAVVEATPEAVVESTPEATPEAVAEQVAEVSSEAAPE
jgi:small subunit ribosomal protein S16